jgi:hypothetical protein
MHAKIIPAGRPRIGSSKLLIASLLSCAVISSAARPSLAQDGPILTEFMANNGGVLLDEDEEASDWVELYNAGSTEVDLSGWVLSDDAADPEKWPFPAVKMAPGGFLVVFCSGKDRKDPALELHTNFRLDNDSEFIILINPSREIVSIFADYPDQIPNVSYGAATDFTEATPLGPAAAVRVAVPADDSLGTRWTASDFDDGSWLQGQFGVGFGGSGAVAAEVRTNVESISRDVNATVLVRSTFSVADASSIDKMTLRVRFDDGYAAFLNGTLIASGNAPAELAWNSEATRSHSATSSDEIDISAGIPALRSGVNVLAIQAMNASAGGNDLFISSEIDTVDVGAVHEAEKRYFPEPTPGGPNRPGLPGIASAPVLSLEPGVYPEAQDLTMSTTLEGGVIRFTTDGREPTVESDVYSEVIRISGSTRILARTFKDGLVPSRIETGVYLITDATMREFDSNLPLVICTTFGRPVGSNCGGGPYTPGYLFVVQPGENGRAKLTGEVSVSDLAQFRRRGSSTCGNPKFAFNVEFVDRNAQDKEVKVFDELPSDSDYIIYAAYGFDRSLMRNPIAYWMSRETGWWAARSRFVEVFVHTGSGPISRTSYHGVCDFMEKNKRDANRVDIEQLTVRDNAEPEVTGGYLMKRDRVGQDEVATSAGGYGSLVFVYPKSPTPAQRNWLTSYMGRVIGSLSPNIGSQEDNELIHFEGWLDHHLLCWYPKNVDAFRLSGYFYNKRGGPVVMGPVWDYDRTMGCADDDRARTPEGYNNDNSGDGGTRYFEAGGLGSWYSVLFQNRAPTGDSPWAQAYRARWRELRKSALRTDRILAQIDDWADEIREAQARNFERWPQVRPRFGGFQGEIDHLKNWLATRAEWIDSEFISSPEYSVAAGTVEKGTQVAITIDSGAAIWYTVDGSDPRGANAQPAASATLYAGPVTIDRNLRIRARGLDSTDGVWSGVTEAAYIVEIPAIVISEIMYHPTDPTAEEDPAGTFSAADLEFIELYNYGSTSIPLAGFELTRGVTLVFGEDAPTLPPKGLAVVVRDEAAFRARYGSRPGVVIVDEFRGTLADGGETLILIGSFGEEIASFAYSNDWHPTTDGAGPSLILKDPTVLRADYGKSESWQASIDPLGSPGVFEFGSTDGGLQRPGDSNQDGRLNVTDAVAVLRALFGGASQLPCGDAIGSPGNTALLDANGDAAVNLTDGVHLLAFIFQAGPAHVLGVSCTPIVGCEAACVP